MIEVIYREDVSEDTIREPRNVTQIGSVDPKYRIYMEDTVLTSIRKENAAENEVYYGLLLGELKRTAGITYLFIRGMAKVADKEGTKKEAEEHVTAAPRRKTVWEKISERGKEASGQTDGGNREQGTGSGAVALERLTLEHQRGRGKKPEIKTEGMTATGSETERGALTGMKSEAKPVGMTATGSETEPGALTGMKSEAKPWGMTATGSETERGALTGMKSEAEPGKMTGEEPKIKPETDVTSEAYFDASSKTECDNTEEMHERNRTSIEFDGDTWARLYEVINRCFPDMEILGWFASFPFLNVAGFDLCRQIQQAHFSGADKVLFLCDRTEREENFYRPDGGELRETEGYFTFFEKNDAMQGYLQEYGDKEGSKNGAATRTQADGTRQGGIRQGTVGEAPRKKWNVSAASVLVTAALLAAVLTVNHYNSKLKSEGVDPADGAAQEGTSLAQVLAVEGQVIETVTNGSVNTDSEEAGDGGSQETDGGNANGEEAGDDDSRETEKESTDGEGAGDGDSQETEGENTNGEGMGDGDSQETGGGNTNGEGAGNGNSQETEGGSTGSTDETENTGSGETSADPERNSGENGATAGSDDSGTTGATGNGNSGSNGTAENGDSSTNGNGTETGSEDETVQTGSRVSARYYTVKNGETLYSICMDVYKTSAMVEIVRTLNGIGEDYAIQEGQKILLP